MTDADEVLSLSKRIVELELNRDADGLAALISDDYVGVDPSGALVTKDVTVGRYRDPDFQLHEHGISGISVRVLGSAAIENWDHAHARPAWHVRVWWELPVQPCVASLPRCWKVVTSQLTPVLRASAI